MAFNTTNSNAPAKRPFYLGLGFIIPVVLTAFLVWFGVSNYLKYQAIGVNTENTIDAMYKGNQNHLGQLVLKVKESMGVANINNEGLNATLKAALEGRYGNDGQGAKQAMLWVKENYPGQYDPQLFVNAQQTILSGRTDFQVKQDLLIDRVRVYKTQTEIFWPSFWLRLAGFPRPTFNFDTYKPVLAEGTEETFKKKVDTGMEIK